MKSYLVGFQLFLMILILTACQSDNTNTDNSQSSTKNDPVKQYLEPDLKVKLPKVDNTNLKSSENPKRRAIKPMKKVSVKTDKNQFSLSAGIPNFQKMKAGAERKENFIGFLRPVIDAENARIKEQRYLIKRLYQSIKEEDRTLSKQDQQWLKAMAQKYRLKNRDFPSEAAFRELLIHVDIIPRPLALAQAANESAWGTSRFARAGNNFFGQWCFSKGCGIVPARRSSGATHEVEAFPTVAHSVRSYMRNLNSHPAYRQLRIERYQQRLDGKQPDGHAMAIGLKKYSAKGMAYVEMIRDMMKKQLPSS